jgi:catechol 2,3-dioxygenase-like lactoylglutathione lyase family enzyme
MEASWHHVAISVRDMERTLGFYRDLLGFEVDWERERYSG